MGQEDLVKEGMTVHSSIPAWIIQWTGEPRGLQSMGWQRAGLDRATKHISANWERTLIRALPGWPLDLSLSACRNCEKFLMLISHSVDGILS